ncbi:MAG: glycosyltransferase family 39 protein, partial [Thermoanaerobaculales bacterium]|nr:glycosyltransferase family 39 protein [Thermoanaerobaculales bacterium]
SAWRGSFGDSVYALRSFGVLWSLIGLGALALLARQLVGDRGAVLAVMAAAVVHPLDFHFAQTARMYSQLAALSTLTAWMLWRWMMSSGVGDRAIAARCAAAYGATAVLLLYTHYLGVVVLVAQGVFALVFFARRRSWFSLSAYLVCAAAVAAAFWPWFLRVLNFRDGLYSMNHLRWIPESGIEDGVGILFHELMWGTTPLPASWSLIARMAAGCAVVGATFLLVRSFVRPTVDSPSSGLTPHGLRVGYAAWLLIGPVGLVLAVSWVYHPIFYPPRFALLVLPPFLVLLGLAVVEIDSVRWKKFVVAVVVGIMAMSTVVEAVVVTRPRMDDLVQVWDVQDEPELVVFFPAHAAKIASYYLGQRVRSATREDVESAVATGAPIRIWVATTRDWRPESATNAWFRDWLLTCGPSRILVRSHDLEVIQIELGSVDCLPTGPTAVSSAAAREYRPPGRGGR